MAKDFDVIVIGAGHAGVEAALASARMGMRTLLATNNIKRTGFMSCNPSIGGLGKGHIVKEIDALGGIMGMAADATCIQFRRLNASKGPAVRGSRAQCDKDLYVSYIINGISQAPNLKVRELEIESLIIDGQRVAGVVATDGSKITSDAVVITTGTFMRAVMHFGLTQIPGGRVGDKATVGISDQLRDFGFEVTRLKTGTPARAYKDSIDWERLPRQSGDGKFQRFSLRSPHHTVLPQIDCHITQTTEKTHEVIRKNLNLSPMFCGIIQGIGPRYCPSIEDKITRFSDKPSHQSFLEPEGLTSDSIYLQGLSTSLPENVQYEFLRTMPGLENVRLIKPGYAVEYDFVEPTQIRHTLETRAIPGLYLAGQINGTSGYEEAAGQGLVAGINAALRIMEKEEFILARHEAYIGVLIDDLVTKGTREPYRMMTSRAEHRLVLREDNAIERLGQRAISLGLVDRHTEDLYSKILTARSRLLSELDTRRAVPDARTQEKLDQLGTQRLLKPVAFSELLRRSEVSCGQLCELGLDLSDYDPDDVVEPVEISVKYSGYIERQKQLIDRARHMDNYKLSEDFDYTKVAGLSREEVEKLSKIRPINIGQASRISGVNPSALQALAIHLKAREHTHR